MIVKVTSESVAEWGSRQAHLNEVGNFLIESTDPQTSRSLAEELRRLNMHWAEFVKRYTFVSFTPVTDSWSESVLSLLS